LFIGGRLFFRLVRPFSVSTIATFFIANIAVLAELYPTIAYRVEKAGNLKFCDGADEPALHAE